MNLKIGHRLGLGFGAIVVLTIVAGVFAVKGMLSIWSSTEKLYRHPFTVSNTVRDIQTDIITIQREIIRGVNADTMVEVILASEKIDAIEKESLAAFDVVHESFLGDKSRVEQTRQLFVGWKEFRDNVLALDSGKESAVRKKTALQEASAYGDTLDADIKFLLDFANGKAIEFFQNAEAAKDGTISTTYTLLISIFIFSMLVSFFIIKNINAPLLKITALLKKIATGDLNEPVDIYRSDEIGQVADSLRRLLETMKDTARQADIIATGDFSAQISPKSDQDMLGHSMQKMTKELREMAQEKQEKRWLDKGLLTLNDHIRGDLSMQVLCERVIIFLSEYLSAQVGVFYVSDGNDIQKLQASYAYMARENLPNTYKPGEGLLGQVVLEKKPILISPCPEDYIRIQSGLGQSVPRNIVVYPLVLNHDVKGVVEFGAFKAFSEADLAFLDLVQEGIAIALNSVTARAMTAQLLEKTQDQARDLQESEGELRVQEEELRQTNMELEEQTQALKESEEKLQIQQEELEQSNADLEEQSQRLEEQKSYIEQKNSEIEKARRKIEEKADDLELTSRYKSEFLANMSHELRTPLNSILLLSKLLSDNRDGVLADDHVESVETIYSSGKELLALINEVLDLSKVEAGKMELHVAQMGLDAFGENLLRSFRPLVTEKGLTINMTVQEGLPPDILTDRQRVEQIVRNFLSNAVKFTHNGSVSLDVRRPETSETENIGLTAERTVGFYVNDTGIGIQKDKQKVIFEAFQQADGTTSRQYGGTGLGLSISRELAKLLGGAIDMTSMPGKGSTFVLYLPEKTDVTGTRASLEKPAEEEREIFTIPSPQDHVVKVVAEEVNDDRKTIQPGDRSILLIEDDTTFLKILRDLSREQGFQCLVAGDGETGLQLAEYHKPSAIILDIGLPGIDGWAVMARLKENSITRHIPVHVISGTDRPIEAMKMGAVDFLVKPVSPDDLGEAFSKLKYVISKPVKDLLVVEDDPISQQTISNMIGNGDVKITAAHSASEAYEALLSKNYDCMILDLGLPDMPGTKLLEKIRNSETTRHIPIIVYTGRELTSGEKAMIDSYSESTIIKGVDSHKKLLDETTLFLHRVEADLPEVQRKILQMMHDKEKIFSNKKILVVDDDMRNVYSLKKTLEDKNMQVVVGKNGSEGLARLKENPDIALVLMDIMMPVMDGYEAMRRIREQQQFKDLAIIALTAKAMKGDRVKCIESGASDYLAKPVDVDRLLSMMRVWLYGRN